MTVVVTTWSSMFHPANTIDGGAAVGALGAIVNGIEIVEDLLLAIVMTVTVIGEGVEVEIGIGDDDRRCWTLCDVLIPSSLLRFSHKNFAVHSSTRCANLPIFSLFAIQFRQIARCSRLRVLALTTRT